MQDLLIGIDPGTRTGITIFCRRLGILKCETTGIVNAMQMVLTEHERPGVSVQVRFEDARLRKWFGGSGREKLQGAGSIRRDCGIWEEFLTLHQIPFKAIAPKNNMTKLPADKFKRITGWKKRTSEHSRDSCMLIFQSVGR